MTVNPIIPLPVLYPAVKPEDIEPKTRDTAWERRLMAVYGITAEQYWEIYEYQNGKCYICQRAISTSTT
ncbi:endonuclease domain-containing protein [Mycobacterium avium]|uniref:endonuclease domain-containing protein n=1 Tax=Mycobacterium avium TaxID=1764 RepID=UPI000CE44778|nr:endonuclease domain-containing protein [Mycobacterium avium]